MKTKDEMKGESLEFKVASAGAGGLVLTSVFPIKLLSTGDAWQGIAQQRERLFADTSFRYGDYEISFKNSKVYWNYDDGYMLNSSYEKMPDSAAWLVYSRGNSPIFKSTICLNNRRLDYKCEVEYESEARRREGDVLLSSPEILKNLLNKHNIPEEISEEVQTRIISEYLPQLATWADTRSKVLLAGRFNLFPKIPRDVGVTIGHPIDIRFKDYRLTQVGLANINYSSNPLGFSASPTMFWQRPKKLLFWSSPKKNEEVVIRAKSVGYDNIEGLEKITDVDLIKPDCSMPDSETSLFEFCKSNKMVREIVIGLFNWTKQQTELHKRSFTGEAFDTRTLLIKNAQQYEEVKEKCKKIRESREYNGRYDDITWDGGVAI